MPTLDLLFKVQEHATTRCLAPGCHHGLTYPPSYDSGGAAQTQPACKKITEEGNKTPTSLLFSGEIKALLQLPCSPVGGEPAQQRQWQRVGGGSRQNAAVLVPTKMGSCCWKQEAAVAGREEKLSAQTVTSQPSRFHFGTSQSAAAQGRWLFHYGIFGLPLFNVPVRTLRRAAVGASSQNSLVKATPGQKDSMLVSAMCSGKSFSVLTASFNHGSGRCWGAEALLFPQNPDHGLPEPFGKEKHLFLLFS